MIGHPKNGLQLGGSNALVKHANHCVKKGMMKLCDYNWVPPEILFLASAASAYYYVHSLMTYHFWSVYCLHKKYLYATENVTEISLGNVLTFAIFIKELKKRTTVQTSKLMIWLLVCCTIYDSKSVEFHFGFYCWEITKIQILQSENFRSVT